MTQLKKTYRAKKTGSTAHSNTLVLKILITVISVLIIWDVAGPFGLWSRSRMLKEREEIYTQNMQLALHNARLEEDIKRLQSDRQYQAMMIRKKLGWVRDNEMVFRFLNEEKK